MGVENTMTSAEWLERSLMEICDRIDGSLNLDNDLIVGLVSFCELAPPLDAADYLTNIIGADAGQEIIQQYLQRRGHIDSSSTNQELHNKNLQPYKKPPTSDGADLAIKKQARVTKDAGSSANQDMKKQGEVSGSKSISKGNNNTSKKKKSGKSISLAEAAKGSIVFQQGLPCSCQARRHKLVSNCLSCGKIVCEQEGEGPCSFCGALVLKEGSTYAGLDEQVVPLSEAEATAESYAKRLVDYDRNSAARTKVIDDQSDYYEIEGNSWLSAEEKALLKKKQNEIKEAEEARKKKVVVTFDLVGRKVVMSKDETSELESDLSILRPSEEGESNRIKPNPTIPVQPAFVTQPRRQVKGKQSKKVANGLCLEISGRVQHDSNKMHRMIIDDPAEGGSSGGVSYHEGDAPECSVDYD